MRLCPTRKIYTLTVHLSITIFSSSKALMRGIVGVEIVTRSPWLRVVVGDMSSM